MKGQLLISEWLHTPWALRRETLSTHAHVLAAWMTGKNDPAPYRAMEDDADDRPRISAFEARRRDANARVGGGIAVVPVVGTVVQRSGMMTEWSGGTSTQQISAALADALADETVSSILMEFDTPGGSVYGVQELADEIVAAKKRKPIYGIANSLSASAGYWLMSQCTECFVTPGGEVGSIGVWQAHEDWSAAMEAAGVKMTLISAGKYKTEGHPYGPLDEDARAFLQKRTDEYYAAFTRAVARGRNVPVETVRSGMGQGRVLGADDALAEKMVDGVMTAGDLVRRIQRNAAPKRSALAACKNDIAILG